ncbi:MAG: Hpt domain-containing protein [Blautia sp.]|nr:Hpt domain-containing protein [Blautia sp.]
MLTIDALKELGADTDVALARCMKNESFYFRLIGIGIRDANFDNLKKSIQEGDLQRAFESAHALKGVMGNLSLNNLTGPVTEITEQLRAREERDYMPQVEKILSERDKVAALLD